MKNELKKCEKWEEAQLLAADGWELVTVLPGVGFYLQKKKKDALKDKARPLRKLSTGDK